MPVPEEVRTPPDRIHAVVQLLRHLVGVLHAHSIPYWVISATLLGAVRNGRMLEWYDDADVSIPAEYVRPFLYAIAGCGTGLRVLERPDRYRVCFHAHADYPFVDVFPTFVDSNHRVVYANPLARRHLPREWFHVDDLFPLSVWVFEDFHVYGASHPFAYLDANFDDWERLGRTNGYINATGEVVPVVEFEI